jgi:hypothetical protein
MGWPFLAKPQLFPDARASSYAMLSPDLVTRLEWWLSEKFEEREYLQAAELVAFEEFDPTLRSRGRIRSKAETLAEQPDTRDTIQSMLREGPTGAVDVPTLTDALSKIERLVDRVERLEARLDSIQEDRSQ